MFDDESNDVVDADLSVGVGDGGDATTHVSRDWRELDRAMRRLAARRAALDLEEARMLLLAKRAEIHRHLGYGSFAEYLERVLGYAPTTGRDRVAEELETLPRIAEAWAQGKLAYSVVREITRVADPDTEEQVLAYVDGLTVREVIGAMRGLEKGDDPNKRREPFTDPRALRMELPPETYALFLDSRRHLEREAGHAMTDAEFLATACRAVLGGGVPAEDRPNIPPHQIALVVCEQCKRGWHDVPGQSIEISPAALDRARCDAVELGRVDDGAATPPPTSRTMPAPTRRAVLARDHHRCRIPGCTMSAFVDVHHIKHWAVDPSHVMNNLLTLCDLHHTLHHEGKLIIAGTPDALVVTHADGRPYGAPPPPDLAADATVDVLIRAALAECPSAAIKPRPGTA